MATQRIELTKGEWKEISTVSVTFQNLSAFPVHVIEAASLPTGGTDGKVVAPREEWTFNKVDGNFYAYAEITGGVVAIDPIG